MIYLSIWFLCGIAAAIIGAKKGEGSLAFIAGILFGPIGLIAAIFSKGNRTACPFCKESINNKATVCPHCQKYIHSNTALVKPLNKNSKALWILLAIFITWRLIATSSDNEESSTTTQVRKQVDAQTKSNPTTVTKQSAATTPESVKHTKSTPNKVKLVCSYTSGNYVVDDYYSVDYDSSEVIERESSNSWKYTVSGIPYSIGNGHGIRKIENISKSVIDLSDNSTFVSSSVHIDRVTGEYLLTFVSSLGGAAQNSTTGRCK